MLELKNLPISVWSPPDPDPVPLDVYDAWLVSEREMRIARGDFSRSDTPVSEPFVWKD